MELKYAFDPDSTFQKKLEEVYAATKDLTIPLTLMSKEWYKGNRSIFALKGPGRYKDLTEKYKKRKQKNKGFIYPILRYSGDLEKSITKADDNNSISYIVNKSTLVLGTKVPYAIYHQSQTEPRPKIPYRPFLFVGVEQIAPDDILNNRLKNWIKILDDYFDQKMKQK